MGVHDLWDTNFNYLRVVIVLNECTKTLNLKYVLGPRTQLLPNEWAPNFQYPIESSAGKFILGYTIRFYEQFRSVIVLRPLF